MLLQMAKGLFRPDSYMSRLKLPGSILTISNATRYGMASCKTLRYCFLVGEMSSGIVGDVAVRLSFVPSVFLGT